MLERPEDIPKIFEEHFGWIARPRRGARDPACRWRIRPHRFRHWQLYISDRI